MSVMEQVLSAIHRLPEEMNYQDAVEEIALLAAIHEAESDISAGRVITNDQMQARIKEWAGR